MSEKVSRGMCQIELWILLTESLQEEQCSEDRAALAAYTSTVWVVGVLCKMGLFTWHAAITRRKKDWLDIMQWFRRPNNVIVQ